VYTLTVTDIVTGCSSTSTIGVIQGSVTAAFTADPSSGSTPLPVSLTNQSIGAVTYLWNFGDGSVGTNTNESHTYSAMGTYTVMLIASSGTCLDTAYTVINVEDGLSIEIPNVFTPNGDGSNDIFTIKSTGVKEISLQIFNRWGQKLYEFTGPKASWDGVTNQGTKVPEGTYFYFVKATGFDNTEIQKNGTANLFR
jgi:gliding motility-associated-like protein